MIRYCISANQKIWCQMLSKMRHIKMFVAKRFQNSPNFRNLVIISPIWLRRLIPTVRGMVSTSRFESALPIGIHMYNNFEKFGIFSKSLVYKFFIWYIWKLWYMLSDTANFSLSIKWLVILPSVNRETIVVLKVCSKVKWFFLTGEFTLGKQRSWVEESWELRNSEITVPKYGHAYLVS